MKQNTASLYKGTYSLFTWRKIHSFIWRKIFSIHEAKILPLLEAEFIWTTFKLFLKIIWNL